EIIGDAEPSHKAGPAAEVGPARISRQSDEIAGHLHLQGRKTNPAQIHIRSMADNRLGYEGGAGEKSDVAHRCAAMIGAVYIEDHRQLAHECGWRRIRKAETVEDALWPRGCSRATWVRVETGHTPRPAEIGLVVGTEGRRQIDLQAVAANCHARNGVGRRN